MLNKFSLATEIWTNISNIKNTLQIESNLCIRININSFGVPQGSI